MLSTLPVPSRRDRPRAAPQEVLPPGVSLGMLAPTDPFLGATTQRLGTKTFGVFKPHKRSISNIVAEVTIEETAEDEVQITEHPVEQGAPITDHAFKKPSTVNIRVGFSVAGTGDLSAENGIYGKLLGLQASFLPFDLMTGKRAYSNMLIERISVSTDETTENALMATLSCRQVFLVHTQTAQVSGASPNNQDHADPSSTGGTNDNGDQNPNKTGTVDDTTGQPAAGETGPPASAAPGNPESSTIMGPPASAANPSTPEAGQVDQQMNNDGAAPPNDPPATMVA